MNLSATLKEWQVAVQALEAGDTILLLRKGGIRELGGTFAVPHPRVWLYPTYEHQKPELLKPPYADRVQSVASGWHPETIRIGAWADITHVFSVQDEAMVRSLLPFHVWNESFVTERLHWKPQQPLYVLLLRVHRLPEPKLLAYTPAYGGCKSWIAVEPPIAIAPSMPVLSEADYGDRVQQIQTVIAALPNIHPDASI